MCFVFADPGIIHAMHHQSLGVAGAATRALSERNHPQLWGVPEGHHEWDHGMQVGVMYDAAEEVMELLRYMDHNNPDLSLAYGECELFRSKISTVWGGGSQVLKVDSYTRMAGASAAMP